MYITGHTGALGDTCPSSLCDWARLESLAKVCGSERFGVICAAFRCLNSPGSTTMTPGFRTCRPSTDLKEALGAADERTWTAFSRKFRGEMGARDRWARQSRNFTDADLKVQCGISAVAAQCCSSH